MEEIEYRCWISPQGQTFDASRHHWSFVRDHLDQFGGHSAVTADHLARLDRDGEDYTDETRESRKFMLELAYEKGWAKLDLCYGEVTLEIPWLNMTQIATLQKIASNGTLPVRIWFIVIQNLKNRAIRLSPDDFQLVTTPRQLLDFDLLHGY